MSSSMKNAAAAAAKPYRERAQPLERRRLGLLEKHKDYSLRAKDYNEKKKKLASLRRKAAEKNEDEFSFGMLSRSGPGTALSRGKRAWTGTVDGDRGNKALSVDTVRLLKTQDLGYIRTMRNIAAKEVTALEERCILAGAQDLGEDTASAAVKTRKIVFLDEPEEKDIAMGGNPADGKDEGGSHEEGEDSDEDSDEGKSKRKSKSKSGNAKGIPGGRNLEKLRRSLQNARKKLKTLADAENELELQRARMAKTKTYGGITKSGKKIKVRERKR